jgi:hypothetical protein
MTNDCEEGHHYCPNCDRSIDVAALQQQLAQAMKRPKLKALASNQGDIIVTDSEQITLLKPDEECECSLNATITAEHQGDGVVVAVEAYQ